MPEFAESLTPGTLFAGYRIERVIGRGGMGTVYVAAHPRLPRYDALKVLSAQHSSDAEFRARFIREAELAARLDHPNIVGVHDRGIEHGRLWIAMQFVDGIDAAALIRRGIGEVPPGRAVHIVGAAARGLDHAHRAGMVHRDVKPANILLESIPGQPDRVSIADFGIARAAAATTALTQVGTVLATVGYAAPEQLTAGTVDHRADVYALGCTLYELLTGAKPFARATVEATIQAHLRDRPPRPASVAHLPSAIDSVIARALAKDPARRYQSCGELASAAAAALGIAPAPEVRVPRPAGRRAVALGAAALVAALLGAAAYALPLRDREAGGPNGPATTTTAAAPNSWGAHEYMVDAFPGLLPRTQTDSGYQGLRCTAVDGDLRPVEVNQSRDSVNWLSCNGDRDPVWRVVVACSTASVADDFGPNPSQLVVADERWQRPSGNGRIIVHDNPEASADRLGGQLKLQFDDEVRKFCNITVMGGNSGRDLYDRWWLDAPL
ncbi:serine/threonine-protein kinase [Nocardia sp. NPDC051832]|uniref:serine/threonine-protein kinase n=1 Tax=Nocardia sp. NPDC051832 TaxID=3155673 RepID=UPI003416423B